MNLQQIFARIHAGKSGTFKVVPEGAIIEPGDIQIGMTFVTEVSESAIGEKVGVDEAIIRLEFEK